GHMARTRVADDYIQGYGQGWALGLLSEHEASFLAAGGRVRTSASGHRRWAILPSGETHPVVCSELVEVWTEDGRMDGRCGGPVAGDGWACEGHATEMEGWRAMSEADKLAWERRQDEEAF